MGKINTLLVGESKIVLEGIKYLILKSEDIEVKDVICDNRNLFDNLIDQTLHILIIVFNNPLQENINYLHSIAVTFPSPKILVISMSSDDDFIYKTLKAGAKGIITKDANRNELIEAIYTLRNGYDYYSKSISRILINNYINKTEIESPYKLDSKDQLSKREIEVLKLWGDGLTNKEISDKMFISIRTVESHKNHIMQKMNLKTTVELVKYAIKNNIIQL